MPLTTCPLKKFLIEWMFLGFAVTFGLRNFHRGSEVK